MTNLVDDPIDAPDGRSYVVRVYRAGTMARFPSAYNAPRPGGALLFPLVLVGWLLHLVAFRRRWTVAVTPWHNLPGPRYREQAPSAAVAATRAASLRDGIAAGQWVPGTRKPFPGEGRSG